MDNIRSQIERIADLDAEELSALRATILEEYSNVRDAETTRETVEVLSELASAAEAVVAESQRREAEAAELAAAADEAGNRIAALDAPEEAEADVESEEAAVDTNTEVTEEDLEEDEEIDPVTGKKRKKVEAEDVVEASVTDSDESVTVPEAAEAAVEEAADTATDAAEASLDAPEAAEAASASVPERVYSRAKTEAPAEETEEVEEVVAAEENSEVESQPEETDTEVVAVATEEEITDNNEDREESGETVTASAAENNENLVVEVPESHRPQAPEAEKATVAITAGADIPGVSAGSPLPNLRSVAQAIMDRRKGMGRTSGGDGEQHTVATFSTTFPEDRVLSSNDMELNADKIRAVVSREAITAAGGLLAPVETSYELFGLEENLGRPVRDSLAVFAADRGGIRYMPVATLDDLDGAASVWTKEDDVAAAGEDGGTKPCIRVEVGEVQEAYVDAIPLCLTFGNMGARFYPEMVERHTRLGMMWHARFAEQRLITRIGTLSTSVDTTEELGAARDVLVALEVAAAGYRNRARMDVEASLRVIFPEWFKNALRADLVKQIPGDGDNNFNLTDAKIEGWFSARNLNVTWSPDGESTQYFGEQEEGDLVSFPDEVIWYLFAEGTFLFLDGGTLDLGLVRDSTLNATNDYKIFLETFEGVAKVGSESLRVTTPVRLYGASAATVDTVGGEVTP